MSERVILWGYNITHAHVESGTLVGLDKVLHLHLGKGRKKLDVSECDVKWDSCECDFF